MQKITLKDLNFNNIKALMRVDLNVPLDEKQNIKDDTRIRAVLPSIKYVIKNGGSVVLMSHLGRPKGEKKMEYSLKPCASRLSELLEQEVIMAPDCVGEEVQKMKKKLTAGQVLLLENVRFHSEEEHPDDNNLFAKELAEHTDVYINDAFGSSHRKHSSVVGVTKYFPKKSMMGLLVEKEVEFLKNRLTDPKRPFIAIIGGAKISSKIGVIKSLIEKADALIIAGAMVHTFLKVQGYAIGKSLNEKESEPVAEEILKNCKTKNINLLLPLDLVVVEEIKQGAKMEVINIHDGVPENKIAVDIGPKSIALFKSELKRAKTIFWNGPLGITEISDFAKGTKEIGEIIATIDAVTIIGGGDSIAAINQLGLTDHMDHISTGGGASLEYIEKGSLPGIDALSEK